MFSDIKRLYRKSALTKNWFWRKISDMLGNDMHDFEIIGIITDDSIKFKYPLHFNIYLIVLIYIIIIYWFRLGKYYKYLISIKSLTETKYI